jgi:hypothetical protein
MDDREFKMTNLTPRLNVRKLYERFNASVTDFDCGTKCSPHNPSGKPFCCDICHAVPVAFHQEWDYLQINTDLWHEWRGDECPQDPDDPDELRAEIPEHMLPLACKGPALCQRNFRALSCRQFPFFPYITSDGRVIGLAYEWPFPPTCWVISNLGAVTEEFRREFVLVYDELLAGWEAEFASYASMSAEMRAYFAAHRRRIPILHRDGGYYLLSPGSERLRPVSPDRLRRFGPHRLSTNRGS